MRIVSLSPSATETLFTLDLGDDLVAITHECDYPTQARKLPRITPILMRAHNSVCALSYDDVRTIAEQIDSQPLVISLDPRTIGEVLGDARTIAQATDAKDAAARSGCRWAAARSRSPP
jgi:iron complex transport system substrate-binding protein